MVFREAQIADIIQIRLVRNSINENRLYDPRLITNEDIKIFTTERGKGWVCEAGEEIVGFSIVDLKDLESVKSCIKKCLTGIFRLREKMFGREPHQAKEQRSFMKFKFGRIPE